MRLLLTYDKMLFPDYAAEWYCSMSCVEALEWYAEPEPCQIIAGNIHITRMIGIRQEDFYGILREI